MTHTTSLGKDLTSLGFKNCAMCSVDSRVANPTAQSREARDQEGQDEDIVEAFRRSLDTVMDEHFSKLDQSLQLLLQPPVPTGTRQ